MRKEIGPIAAAIAGFLLLAPGAGDAAAAATEQEPMTAAGKPAEGGLEVFLGEPRFEIQDLFAKDRFANVVVATDGTVLAFWGSEKMRMRRSDDGGASWSDPQDLPIPALFDGCVMVDENTGDILSVSLEKGEDILWRSSDQGKTWKEDQMTLKPNEVMKCLERTGMSQRVSREGFGNRDDGYWMRTSHGESGITLRHGANKGRLLMYAAFRPHSKTHPSDRDPVDAIYSCAIYSDDGGATWQVSGFFPEGYTEEAALAELHDGRIYYNSRSHKGYYDRSRARELPEEASLRRTAWSCDGGETWEGLEISRVLPDGGGYGRGYGMMGGLVRLPVKNRDILVFSNTDTGGGAREKMTVWASFDGGKTWPLKRLVHAGPSAYSSMAAGRPQTASEGWIYLQLEGGAENRYDGCKIARFNLSWLLKGEATGDGEVPQWVSR